MATKTISVDLDAYRALCEARLSQKESFSQVIHRARWEKQRKTCGQLLAALPSFPLADEETIRRLDAAQRDDAPPDNPWA